MQTVERVGKIEFNHNMVSSQTLKVTVSRVDGCLAAPSNVYSELSRAKQRSHACRAASIGTFGSQASQSHAYIMIVYNYDADLEVSDTCVRSSLLS